MRFGKMSALTAALLLGVLHVIWHLLADYVGAIDARGAYWLPRFVGFCLAMIAMRIILVWVYENTKSLLMAQLMHASSTGFLAILVPLTISPANDTIFHFVYALLLWIVAAIIIIRFGSRMTITETEEITAA